MKNILLGIYILSVSLSGTYDNGKATAENGKLSGTVTYNDTYVAANKPDAGCELFIMNEADLKSSKYAEFKDAIERFQRTKYYCTVSSANSVDPARNKKLGDEFDTISDLSARFIRGFRELPGMVKAGTNGSGSYSVSLKPGKYYILFVSGNVKSKNTTEVNGNIGYKMVEIKSVKTTFQNAVFQMQEFMGIMPLNLSGC
jgi:hypothetical protein